MGKSIWRTFDAAEAAEKFVRKTFYCILQKVHITYTPQIETATVTATETETQQRQHWES